MPKFATVGTIEVTPGQRDQLLPLLVAHKARCLKDEPDTLQFENLLPKCSSTKSIETTPYSRCTGTGRPSHGGEKRLPEWW